MSARFGGSLAGNQRALGCCEDCYAWETMWQMAKRAPRRIPKEELANSITHGLGLMLSVAGFVVLVVLAILRGGAWHIVSCSVYGLTLVCLYAASTLYHSLR